MILIALAIALTAQSADLRIVVIAGEDAVNIIQQKTAVAPIVEVRDRNDQPVAGALVLFSLDRGAPATFANAARTLSLTTDGAGRATAIGLTPTSKGTLRVSVTAKSGERTASVLITQTNVETAAQAAAITTAAGVAGGAVGAGAAAGGAGGGLSTGAIVGIAGAIGGGALVAAKAVGGDSGNSTDPSPQSSSNPPPSSTSPTGPTRTTYTGPVNSQWAMTTTSGSGNNLSTCVSTRVIAGTLTITLDVQANGGVTGTASTSGTQSEISVTGSPLCSPLPGSVPFANGGPVTGTAANLGYRSETSSTGTNVTVITTTTFSGALTGTVISGMLTHGETSSGQGLGPPGSSVNGSGSTTFPVTLNRQ